MSAIYLLEDLFPGEGIYGTAEVQFGGIVFVRREGFTPFSHGMNVSDEPGAVRSTVRRSFAYHRVYTSCPPAIDRDALVEAIKARHPLTAEDLLLDKEFLALAWKAAYKRKSYLAEMLAWEKKSVCIKAVKLARAEHDASQAKEAARQKAVADAAEAKRLAEQPTVDAVLAAYHSCGYAKASQGHDVRVELIEADQTMVAASIRCDMVNGGRYSSRCTYQKKESRHVIRVRHDWLEKVRKLSTSTIDDCLVLDASETNFVTVDGHRVFDVKVAKQSRGTSLAFDWVPYCPFLGRTVTGRDKFRPKRDYLAGVVGLSSDVPDYALHDALEEAGISV